MEPEAQDRVIVVLVRARNPSNIGAAARAMHDLGFGRLRIVNPYPVPFHAAKSAVDASAVLAAATEHDTLAAALSDCSLVFGTTAVGERVLEHPLHGLREAAALARGALAAEQTVALVFGSEKTGLSNDELSLCHALLTIPMSVREGQRHLSMNLGQAVAVCLYELAQPSLPPLPVQEAAASGAELERLDALLTEVFDRSGYARRNPANARPASIRRLTRRMALTPTDAPVWTGVLRQVLHALRAAKDDA